MANTTNAKPYGNIKFTTINEYHNSCNDEVKIKLEQLRNAITQAAPTAIEVISYNMPAFKLTKVLVYYAAYKNHIGFYPTAQPIQVFKNELVGYKTSKGAIQFELNKPLPIALIKKITKYRAQQNALLSK
jgi:uncharacterized protein YdhG (YjbR/CyaY superfamily)